jgi:GR25 family glycosyltransferase involved in LPS biosynthesis
MTTPLQVPVYYINLASRPDRRAFMEEQFAQLGIVAHRVEAVRIDEVPPELIAFHQGPDCLWRSNPGDLACGLSHERTWNTILEAGHRAALVFEDDAVLTPAIADFLPDGLLDRLQVDLIKLETFRIPIQLGSTGVAVGTTTLRELCSSQMGSAAYLISRDAIQTSLASPMLRELSVDRLLFGRGGPHLLRSRLLQAVPSPCIQLNRIDPHSAIGVSDLHQTRAAAPSVRYLRDAIARAKVQADHLARLVRLALRDSRAAFGARVVVQYAGDPPAE